MHHVVAFTGSVANTANIQLNALSDDIAFIQNNNFMFQQDVQLLFAALMSATIARGRLNSPSMRQVAPKYIRPPIAAVIPGNNPNVDYEYMHPFILRGQEEITAEVTHTNAMAERVTLVMGVADRVTPAPAGPVYPMRVTSVGPAVANVWTTIALTFETALPVGVYAVTGAEMFSANCQAFRLIFDNQTWRPGFLGINAIAQRNNLESYNGIFGEWGRFRTTSLPRCQVLCNAADATFEGYLNCVRLPGI